MHYDLLFPSEAASAAPHPSLAGSHMRNMLARHPSYRGSDGFGDTQLVGQLQRSSSRGLASLSAASMRDSAFGGGYDSLDKFGAESAKPHKGGVEAPRPMLLLRSSRLTS